MPARSRRWGGRQFDRKLQLLDRIGMPFAPKNDQDLRQPTPQDPAPVHPGMAAGAERHQLGVVAGLCMTCYRRRRYSVRFFGGNRDSALDRDGRACRGCNARDYLNVHHRWRGDHTP